jgi:hypothetical protein
MIKRKTQWTDRAQRQAERAMTEAAKLELMEASFRRQREARAKAAGPSASKPADSGNDEPSAAPRDGPAHKGDKALAPHLPG